MTPSEIFNIRTNFNLWLAFLIGLGGLIVGAMCLWKVYRLNAVLVKQNEIWVKKYERLAERDEKIVDELHRIRKGQPPSSWLQIK